MGWIRATPISKPDHTQGQQQGRRARVGSKLHNSSAVPVPGMARCIHRCTQSARSRPHLDLHPRVLFHRAVLAGPRAAAALRVVVLALVADAGARQPLLHDQLAAAAGDQLGRGRVGGGCGVSGGGEGSGGS